MTHTSNAAAPARSTGFDPVLMAVLANRLDGIVREMTNTLLRTGRSAILNTARDFSCSLVTPDNQLLSAAEGLPIHVIGSQLLTRSMNRNHPNIVEGDAFLHNDPYDGNTHHADHTILVPIFFEGVHVLTAVAKAHQADIGNSQPTTYAAYARDLYEEGAINYPCVKVQSGYEDVDDIIRMSKMRIRVPEQWYGDYLAALGAARVGERRVKEMLAKYGAETFGAFVDEWFDYSEKMMIDEIRRLPAGRLTASTSHDPIPALDGATIPLNVGIEIDPVQGRITVDLRDNIDCVPAGYNLSEATALACGISGVLNQLASDIPYNEGTFRRVDVLLRENCVAGIPRHPFSASVSTSNVADRVINMTQAAFADLGEGFGMAEGSMGQGPGMAVISGVDDRRDEQPYVNQLYLSTSGGPATCRNDGWGFYGVPVCAGLMYRDSVEIDERKFPIIITECRVLADSEGAGEYRGAPGGRVVYGPTTREVNVMYAIDGSTFPPSGVRGGGAGRAQTVYLTRADGERVELPHAGNILVRPGEFIGNETNGGGGYGDPLRRDAEAVRADVESRYLSAERAREVYGVVTARGAGGHVLLDAGATEALRQRLRTAASRSGGWSREQPFDSEPGAGDGTDALQETK